jgi:hypothetical protein
MVRINDTATVELQRVGHAATLLVQRPPIGLAINITLVELERLAVELAQDARLWRQAQRPDYYTVLGVSSDATLQTIRAAYRRLSRKHHPDVSAENSGAAMQHVNAAYEILSDPAKRKKYDQSTTI